MRIYWPRELSWDSTPVGKVQNGLQEKEMWPSTNRKSKGRKRTVYPRKCIVEPYVLSRQYREHWHDNVVAEHKLVTEGVGIKDLTPFAKFYVDGSDAHVFLDRLVAGRVPSKIGRASVVHALTPEGKVYAELTLTKVSQDRFMVVTGAGVEGHDLRYIQMVSRC